MHKAAKYVSLIRRVPRARRAVVRAGAALLFLAHAFAPAAPPDFARDIQPILSEKCYQCHGPDAAARKADLRLDQIAEAIEEGVIVPGDPAASAVSMRTHSPDARVMMPPPKSNKSLDEREKALINDWIASGAKHAAHWAFEPIRKPPIPEAAGEGAPAGAIDSFILARLKAEGLAPAREADRETLLRRVSFDLTGLPPTIAEQDAFLADQSAGAFEKVVDRLLASPRYGERMAADWLDASRYADTFGYQNDREMRVWPWRDWTIRAFNANMPYDQFVTEQLAGDLLENPTPDQRLATAFNRLHRQTNEGGSVEEEFRLEYVADRTEVFGTALLGLTLECARCHDHKFDPASQRDFYALSAFFGSIDESGLYSHFTETAPTPAMPLYGPGQEEEQTRLIAAAETRLAALQSAEEQGTFRFMKWAADPARVLPERKPLARLGFDTPPADGKLANDADPAAPASVSGPYAAETGPDGNGAIRFDGDNSAALEKVGAFERSDPFTIAMRIYSAAHAPRMVVLHRSEAALDAASRGYEIRLDDGRVVFALTHFWPGNALCVRTAEAIPAGQWAHLAATYDGSSSAAGVRIYVDGKPARLETIRDGLSRTIRYGEGATPALRLGARFRDNGFSGGRLDDFRLYDAELAPLEIEAMAAGTPLAEAAAAALKRPGGLAAARAAYFAAADEPAAKLRGELRAARAEEAKFAESIPQIMVMQELPEPRPAHLLARGSYLEKREEAAPDTPHFLSPFPEGAPRNRLGLARWLFLPEHPLTARVAANRLWAQMFGRGLVATPEDFGVQGDPPAHPELLDYLAARYRELNWDTKAMLREIALSAAYRQSSEGAEEAARRDPENALLARGPRHRLSAEEIRDAALAASGLISEKLGGPSVKPYQPEGIWKDSSGVEYVQDTGEALYRRSLYTFIKRTAPPPSMLMFDATGRESCVVRRERTETPLQALQLLNDPQFVEAARVLAERALEAEPEDAGAAIAFVFRALAGRRPTERQMEILLAAEGEQRAWFEARAEEAAQYLKVGEKPANPALPPARVASLTAVAQLAMNYDEFRMKR